MRAAGQTVYAQAFNAVLYGYLAGALAETRTARLATDAGMAAHAGGRWMSDENAHDMNQPPP
ncbi:hypothetical protein [Actinomadura sp. HBU206391]|uniref:hypothetical protein n=1 Tax=Actinomadura sp. HBU206391 TaxID=2731692 RepID=UPI00164FCD3E|nr:hypothetical protein [Actinomadura sp. HBU206391]MBC6456447.1 hypothetical protein [Actinomadura sp. HBU206391]